MSSRKSKNSKKLRKSRNSRNHGSGGGAGPGCIEFLEVYMRPRAGNELEAELECLPGPCARALSLLWGRRCPRRVARWLGQRPPPRGHRSVGTMRAAPGQKSSSGRRASPRAPSAGRPRPWQLQRGTGRERSAGETCGFRAHGAQGAGSLRSGARARGGGTRSSKAPRTPDRARTSAPPKHKRTPAGTPTIRCSIATCASEK